MAITHLVTGEYKYDPDGKFEGYVKHPFPVWQTDYVGRVISVYRRDYQAMSDVYTIGSFAHVLNDKGAIVEILVNANFECDVGFGHAEVDATDEVLATKAELDRKATDAQKARDDAAVRERLETERNRPVKGKAMIVVKGRKVAVGTKGIVAYVSDTGRVLLKDPSNWTDRNAPGIWVAATNLKAQV